MATLLSIGVFLIVSIITLLLLYVFLLLIRGCFRIFVPTSVVNQFSSRSLVLSAGATAVLFWETTDFLIKGFIIFFLDSFDLFSSVIAKYVTVLVSDSAEIQVMQEVQYEMTTSLPQLTALAKTYLYNVSVPSVIAALAVFVMLAGAFNGSKNDSGDQAILLRLRDWFQSLDQMRKGRLALGFAVLCGTYLSMAAILSIPWLYDVDDVSPMEEGMLRAQLISSTTTDSEWQQQWEKEFFTNNPLEPLEKLFETTSIEKVKEEYARTISDIEARQQNPESINYAVYTSAEEFNANVDRVPGSIENIKNKMLEISDNWQQLKQSAQSNRAKSLDEAIAAYQNYKDKNLSDRERQRFRDDLLKWYTNRIANIDEGLRSFQRDVQWYETSWRRWALQTSDDLNRAVKNLYYFYYSDPYLDLEFTYRFTSDPFYLQPPPSPRDPSEIGIFGFFAQWLISTKSYTVALLFGMIGFGLIGSVVSRVLSSVSHDQAGVKAQGTFDVVMVGVSASTIIFLASQGGLAIFASGETQPNGYILFLAALIGSAYGDRVWETARERFFERLNQQNKNETPEAEANKGVTKKKQKELTEDTKSKNDQGEGKSEED